MGKGTSQGHREEAPPNLQANLASKPSLSIARDNHNTKLTHLTTHRASHAER